jgi:hypothetical protein
VIFLGKKNQARTVGSGGGETGDEPFIEIVGYLQKHTGTVTGLIVRTFRAPVFHPFQDFKAPLQNIMGYTAFYVRHEADAAGIMLILFPIQTHLFARP